MQSYTDFQIKYGCKHVRIDTFAFVSVQLVKEEGGFEVVCKERRWTQIAMKMGFAPGKAVGSHLRAHFERILYPYYLFQKGTNLMVRLA